MVYKFWEKIRNVIFRENPHYESLVVHADRLDEANSWFSELFRESTWKMGDLAVNICRVFHT